MMKFYDIQKELKYYFSMLHDGKRGYIIFDDSLYYVPDEDWCYLREDNGRLVFFDMPDSIIKVSDCYISLYGIIPHLPTGEKQIYTIYIHIYPCHLSEKNIQNTAMEKFNLTIKNGVFFLSETRITGYATNRGFTVWNKTHFCNALSDLLKEALFQRIDPLYPYFFTGYKSTGKSFATESIEDIFLSTYPKSLHLPTSLQSCIDNIVEFIEHNTSSGMVLLYSLFAITYTPMGKQVYNSSDDFYSLPVQPFNYCGKNIKAVRQNVNLFANFFKADNRSHSRSYTSSQYSAVLDSVDYCLDNYTVFKDIPLIVRKIRSAVTSKSKHLSEIITLRASNCIGFFPVIISNQNLKIAEVLSVECTDNAILSVYKYQELKNDVNNFFRCIIDFMNSHPKFFKNYPHPIDDELLASHKYHNEYTDSIMYVFLQKALEMICFVLKHMCCNYSSLQSLLQRILDGYIVNNTVSVFPPNMEDMYTNLTNPFISKTLNYVKDLYEQHKYDNPQKTVWISEQENFTDNEVFSPFEHDNRLIYICNDIIEKFIKNKLHAKVQPTKQLLFDKRIILKNGNRYTFKKHDKGEHVCLCFYAEYLELSDRDEHLSLN